MKDLDYVWFGGRYLRKAYGDLGGTAVGSRRAFFLDAMPPVCGLPNTVPPPPLLFAFTGP